jgi:hypothetical protein
MSRSHSGSNVIDIDKIGEGSNRSMRFEEEESSVVRVRRDVAVSSSRLNIDNPRPDVSVQRSDLIRQLEAIDRNTVNRVRPTIDASRGVTSVRMIHQNASRDSNGMSARSYRVDDYTSKMPDKKRSPEERAYVIRQKFIKLNNSNPQIEIPNTQDPDALERMYVEALRTHHYSKINSSWFIYLGVGYVFLQYLLNWFGLGLPDNFASYQLRMLSCYHDILRQMGDPGGISMGSTWPPWVKLLVIIVVQTVVFILVFKMTKGNAEAAAGVQELIASTKFLGGKKTSGDVEAEGAAVQAGGIMDVIGGLFGGGGGAGIAGVIGNLFGGGGMGQDDDIDLDDLPEPDDDEDEEEEVRMSSRRSNMFD